MLSSNTFGRTQIWNKKIKIENLINDGLDRSSSDNENDSDSDNDTDNESGNETDND